MSVILLRRKAICEIRIFCDGKSAGEFRMGNAIMFEHNVDNVIDSAPPDNTLIVSVI
jgi:hypothetical protein